MWCGLTRRNPNNCWPHKKNLQYCTSHGECYNLLACSNHASCWVVARQGVGGSDWAGKQWWEEPSRKSWSMRKTDWQSPSRFITQIEHPFSFQNRKGLPRRLNSSLLVTFVYRVVVIYTWDQHTSSINRKEKCLFWIKDYSFPQKIQNSPKVMIGTLKAD